MSASVGACRKIVLSNCLAYRKAVLMSNERHVQLKTAIIVKIICGLSFEQVESILIICKSSS